MPQYSHRPSSNLTTLADAAVANTTLKMRSLTVEHRTINELKLRPGNARTHSPKQIEQIANSIREFGFTNPVLIDDEDIIVAGHGRVAAAKLCGLLAVPTIRLTGMSKAQIRAYVMADNRLAELAGWDRDILAIEFQELFALSPAFDVTISGFETAEIDFMIGGPPTPKSDPNDKLPEMIGPVVSRPGDLWQIGKHRVYCGSALKAASYVALLQGEKAQFVFIDPPYNVPVQGHVSGLGRTQHREFSMASGEMTTAEFRTFLRTSFDFIADHAVDGAIVDVAIDWRHISDVLAAGGEVFADLKNICVWTKTNAGMGSFYRSQHEFFAIFKNGTAAHINNVELGKHGRYRTNVWPYAGYNSFGAGRDEALASHPTVKPVALVMDAIKDCSKRNGLVLDSFAGSGTTLVAAHKAGRRGAGIELDPAYVDLMVHRMEQVTKESALLAGTHETFADVARRRATEAPSGSATPREAIVDEAVASALSQEAF